MFGLGPTELFVILVLGLLVLGPERIPGLAANLGKAIRSFRRATRDLRDQIEIDDEVRRPFEDLRAALRDEPPPNLPQAAPRLEPPGERPVPSVFSETEKTEKDETAAPPTGDVSALAPPAEELSVLAEPIRSATAAPIAEIAALAPTDSRDRVGLPPTAPDEAPKVQP